MSALDYGARENQKELAARIQPELDAYRAFMARFWLKANSYRHPRRETNNV